MDWIKLTPEALGAFIVLLLTAVATVYVFSLKNKSRQTWALICYLLLLSGFAGIGFLQQASPFDWLSLLFLLKLMCLMLMQLALLNFAILFLNYSAARSIPVVIVVALIVAVCISIALIIGGLGLQLIELPVIFRRFLMLFFMVLGLAPAWVFFTRSVSASITGLKQAGDNLQEHSPVKAGKVRLFWSVLINPACDHASVLRRFGLLTMLPLIPFVIGALVLQRLLPIAVRDLMLLVVGSVYVSAFVILYLSYAEERSSIHAKLVGLSLVTALLVLQVVGAVLFTPGRLAIESGIRSLDQHVLRFTADPEGGYQIQHGVKSDILSIAEELDFIVHDPGLVELEFEFPFYGQSWRSIHIAESGFLALGAKPGIRRISHIRNMLGYENYNREIPRIMGLDAGLRLDQQASISYAGDTDRVVFSWNNLVQRHNHERSSFQIVLHRNGNIDFIYQDIGESLDIGVIGLSPGGENPSMQALNLFEMTSMHSPAGSGIWENLTLRYRNHAHRQVSRLMMIALGTAALIIVGFPFFYRVVLTRPMQQLLDGLRLVDHGALDTEITVTAKNELGSLAAHFNRMTASLRQSEQALKQHAGQLEQQVQQRTRELADQNILLERQWQQLQEIDKTKSRLFANLSHEFRTPLTLTIGSLEDIHSGLHGPQSAEVLQQLELAMRNSRRVLRLINQMLDIAKIEADQLSLQIETLDLSLFLSNLGQIFVPLAERKQMIFDVDVPAQAVWIDCDPQQLEKVFTNLLSNAFKFTPEGGAVRLTMQADLSGDADEMVTVTVRDNGPGITADKLPQVFERFYQIEEQSYGLQTGSGIGLALARELVGLHNGQITADSEPGFGSTFTVGLPLNYHKTKAVEADNSSISPIEIARSVFSQTEQQIQDLVAESEISLSIQQVESGDIQEHRTTILVVDDNAEIRSYIRKHLLKDYRVVEAQDGKIALELARSLLPDLVVSDVMMPNMNGSELCDALKGDPELNYLPVILLTAKATEEDKLEGLSLGADDYLAKPFSMPELIARIKNLIDSRRRLKARYTRPIQLAAEHMEVDSADQSFLKRLLGVIEKQLGDPEFSVEQLAQAIGQSRGNLHRRLRNIVDQTPRDVIRDIRLQRGAELLEQRVGSISEIAYTVGFKGVAHFSTSFRNKYGVPPSAYTSTA